MFNISLETYGILSLIIGAIGYIGYFHTIYKGRTKPHAFSWFIWGALTGIAYFAQISAGAGAGAWVSGFTSILCFVVVIIALFRGEKNITKSDWATFITALAAIPLWLITSEPLYAILIVTVIDALGFWPTFRKSWDKPHEEPAALYALAALKFYLSIMAIQEMNIITSLYPASLVFLNMAFVCLVLLRRTRLRVA